MDDQAYQKLAKVLDTLPNGFPASESGVEIKLLKRIFKPEQVDLFCDLRLTFETAEEIAKRIGRPLEGLKEKLMGMARDGQLFTIKLGDSRYFRMLPWVFGIYEFQLERMDREFAEMVEEYAPVYGKPFFSQQPQLMQTLTVEETISCSQEALPYEKVSTIIEGGQSFMVNDCICKKEKGLLETPCSRTVSVCLAVAPVPNAFDKSPVGRAITKQEAYDLMKKSEEEGLVHLTANIQFGHIYICNCCKCCCGVLRAINQFGIPAPLVVNSHYYAVIDQDSCIGCGICAGERCQVNAIDELDDTYKIIPERCIGCGLCVSHCPVDAIRMLRKEGESLVSPPITEDEWFAARSRFRGVDFSSHK